MDQPNPGQSTEADDAATADRTAVDQPSSTVRRQRSGSKHTGAFGQRTGHSDLLFFEGVLPSDGSEIRSDEPIHAQTERCLDRLEERLSSVGLDLEDILRVRLTLTDLDERDVVDRVYASRFDGSYPPRTTTGVCELPGGADVQLEVVAADE
ncbi:RidA family protein [Halosolutus amylolyticus]|uniref:RidA family protein n=1 Tax=Halosolutus amylolyticus TaxID=2932267 RepID=A0ABD5PPL3_9EURY|nr:RidA family protein [Halosolutus amylolyticus]